MKSLLLPLLGSLLAGALPLASRAADDSKNAGKSASHLAASDEKFVMKAAQGGMMEVKLGEIAKQKGKRDDVKKFGDMMVTDHSKANDDLKAVATKKGLTLPEQLDAIHAGSVDRLSKLEGDQFDPAYIDEMLKDHQKDVAEFEKAAKSTKDSELKAFVEKTLPTLRAHLEHVQGLTTAKK